MSLIFTVPGILGLLLHAAVFLYFARALPLGALSVPCVAVLTSFIYFYFMPVAAVSVGNDYLFGMQLNSLEDAHWLAILYITGLTAACGLNKKLLCVTNPSSEQSTSTLNPLMFAALWGIFVLSIAGLFVLGLLNVTHEEDYQFATGTSAFNFVTLGLALAQPLTVIYLVRNDFRLRSLAVLAAVLYVFTVAGFRSRTLILLCAVTIAFMMVRRIKIRVSYVLLGATIAVAAMNLFGMLRQYGAGLQLGRLQSFSLAETLTRFGGEIGIVYVTQYAAANPPQWIWFDPYIVAFFRYIPTFIWPDKPVAAYTAWFSSGFLDQRGAAAAGLAAPQQVEMLYQFGWAGVLALSFVYYCLIARLQLGLVGASREARIAGLALMPGFFGFYMQQRGYFFEMSAIGLFTFLPLFLVNKRVLSRNSGRKRQMRLQPVAVNRGLPTSQAAPPLPEIAPRSAASKES